MQCINIHSLIAISYIQFILPSELQCIHIHSLCKYADCKSPVHVTRSLRTYPLGLGHGLKEIMTSWQAQPKLRQKRPVDVNLSDREMFNSLPLGDVWADAQLIDVYKYLRKSKNTMVPNTWVPLFEELDRQIEKF